MCVWKTRLWRGLLVVRVFVCVTGRRDGAGHLWHEWRYEAAFVCEMAGLDREKTCLRWLGDG